MTQDSSIRYGGFEFRTVCSECKQSMAVNGPLLELACARCGAVNQMSPERIAGQFERMERDYPEMGPGERQHFTAAGNQRQWRCAIVAEQPRCAACQRPLPVVDIPVGSDEDRTCECGEPYSTYPAPAWFKGRLDTAVQIYSADRPAAAGDGESGGLSPQVVGGPSEAIVMACPQCAAGLEVSTETARHADCKYCGAKVELPPVLWRKLHPLPRMRTWYARFEGPSLAMKEKEAEQRRRAERAQADRERERKERRSKLISTLGWVITALIALAVILFAAGKGGDDSPDGASPGQPKEEAAP